MRLAIMRRWLWAVWLITTGAGCAAPQQELIACPPQGCAALDVARDWRYRPLAEHAARDLACPPPALDVSIHADDARVAGCGRQARYAWIHQRSEGRWVLDSPVSATAP